MDEQMIRKHKRKYKNDAFAINEVILVWLGSKRSEKRASQKRYVVKEKILKMSCWSGNEKLSLILPSETTPTPTAIWTLIENITNIKGNPKDNKNLLRSRFLIPLTN